MREGLLPQRITDALEFASSEVGLDPSGARLVRMHSNTVFHLPTSDAVARIATSGPDIAERIAASLTATEWLATRGFSTVKPKVGRAVEHGGLIVSFWVYEETVQAERSLPALARLLRELHAITDVSLDLPFMPSPLGGVARAVDSHPQAFDGNDRDWLANEISECERRWSQMKFSLPHGLIHGDAHPNNLLYTDAGALLCDWDHVSYGPREWDLVQSVYFHRRFPVPGDDLGAFAGAYGWDLRDWPDADDLVAVREISDLGSYIRTAAAKPEARTELAYRLQTLRDGDTTAPWNSPSRS